MADKQASEVDTSGPFHSFRVTHVTRPGGGQGGGSEVSTGHLNAHDAIAWIRQVGKDHGLTAGASVHPAHGVPTDVAAVLQLDGPDPAAAAAAAWDQRQLEDEDERAAQAAAAGSEADAGAS